MYKKNDPATKAGRKVEPSPRAVNVTAVSRLGNMIGNHSEEGTTRVPREPLIGGRGYRAPSITSAVHKGGSQGRH